MNFIKKLEYLPMHTKFSNLIFFTYLKKKANKNLNDIYNKYVFKLKEYFFLNHYVYSIAKFISFKCKFSKLNLAMRISNVFFC